VPRLCLVGASFVEQVTLCTCPVLPCGALSTGCGALTGGCRTHLSPRCLRMAVTLGGQDCRVFVLDVVRLSAVSALWAWVISAWAGPSPPVVGVVQAPRDVPIPASLGRGRVPAYVPAYGVTIHRIVTPASGSCSGSYPPGLVCAGLLYWPVPVGVACLGSSAWWGIRLYCFHRWVIDTSGVTRSAPV